MENNFLDPLDSLINIVGELIDFVGGRRTSARIRATLGSSLMVACCRPWRRSSC